MASTDGIFFLVAGPAGVGKTTLLAQLVAQEKNLVKAVSVTTRAPRAGEVDGVAYHFWNDERFKASVAQSEFLEHAQVHGQWYGTLARFVLDQLNAGLDVVKDIDVQGVEQIRNLPRFQSCSVSVFVMPPSREELIKRLEGRSSESAESLEVRLRTAEAEMSRAGEFDYIVVNDALDTALSELKAIRAAEHCRSIRRQKLWRGLSF
jgi:guanylate kinase